jgi:hypothetical protein
MSNIKDLVLLIKQLKKIGVIKKKRRRRNRNVNKEAYRQNHDMGKGFVVSNPQQLKGNPVQENINNADLVRISKELHDSKSKGIKEIEDVNNRFTDFHEKAKNAFGILLDDNNQFRNRMDYYENQQPPPRFKHDTVVMDPSNVSYKINDDDDDNDPDYSYLNNMENVQEELQGKLNNLNDSTDPNDGYSNNDGIDVPVTGDFVNTTQHKPHDTQFIDSSVAGGSYTDPVVGFLGGMLGLNSPARTPTITTRYRSPIRAREEVLTPITASNTRIVPTKVVEPPPDFTTVKQRLQYFDKKGQTPQPQPSPPKPQSLPRPPATENKDESEDEDEPEDKDEDKKPPRVRLEILENLKKYYYDVIGGTDPIVDQMKNIPKVRKECIKLLLDKYYHTIRHNSDLLNKDIIKSNKPEEIYDEILRVKQIKAERKAGKKAQRDKARKDFS